MFRTLENGCLLHSAHRAFVLLILPFATACTKAEPNAKFRLIFPDFRSEQAVKNKKETAAGIIAISDVTYITAREPDRIAVQVVLPDGRLVEQLRIRRNGALPTTELNFAFEVPRNSAIGVQALVVTKYFTYEETTANDGSKTRRLIDTSGEEYFHKSENWLIGESAVDKSLNLEKLIVDSSSAEGTISGRFLEAANQGPTGRVNIRYDRGSGQPPIKVAEMEMHGGWFRLPAFQALKFVYELESPNGTRRNLFPNFQLSQPNMTFGVEKILATAPAGYVNEYNNGQVSARRFVGPAKAIFGYFSDAGNSTVLANKKVCFIDSAVTDDSTDRRRYKTSATTDSDYYQWVGRLTSTNTGIGVSQGGEGVANSQTGDCPTGAGTELLDWMKPLRPQLSLNEGLGAYQGIFRAFVSQNQNGQLTLLDVQQDFSNQKLNLGWRYLPGVTGPNRVTGLRALYRVRSSSADNSSWRSDYERDSGIACGEIINNPSMFSPQFISLGDIPISNEGVGPQTASLPLSSSVMTSYDQYAEVVLCPQMGSGAFASAGMVGRLNYQGGNQGGSNPSPTPYPSSTPYYSPTPYPSSTPYYSPTPYPSSTPYYSPTPYPSSTPYYSPTPYPSSTPYYSPTPDPSSTPYYSPTPYPSSTPTYSPTPYPSSTPYATATPYPSATPYANPSPTASPSATPVNIYGELRIEMSGSNYAVGNCVPMRVANYVSGTALSVAVDTYVNVSAQSPNGSSTGYFYADSTCSGSSTVTATTVLLASGSSSSSQFYFKDPVASYWNLRAQSTGYNEGYSPLYFVASETPSQIQVQLGFEPSVGTSYHLVSGRCYEAEVRLASQQNYPANNANRSFSLQFSANSGAQAFASLDGCLNGGTANSTLSFSSTEAVKRFALKPGTSSGSLSLSSTGLTTVQVAYDISDGSLSSVRLEPFEELSSFTGPLFHPPVNAYGCFALKVQPRASNGAATNVAANTSATVSSSDYVFSFNDTCLNSSASLSVMLPSDYRQSVIFAKPATSGFLKGAAAVSGASGSSTTTELMRRPDSIEFSDLPIANAAQEPQLMQNYCQKITFRALWSGATATLPMEMRFKFIHSSGSSLYTNSSCLTSVANDIVTIASGQPSVGAVWVRSSGAVGDPVKIMPVVVGSSVQWGQLLMRVVAPPSFSIMHSPSGTMSSGQCVGLMPSVGSSLLGPVVAKLMIQSSTNLQGNGSGGYFYSDSSCTQAAGSNLQATMPAGTNSYLMPPMGYVKFATPLTTGTPMIQLQVDGFANAVLVVNGPSSCGSSNCIW